MNEPMPPPIPTPYTEGPVTIREVYALLGQTRAEVLAAVGNVETRLKGELDDHEREHERQHADTVSRGRYALTTALTLLLSILGNAVAIVLALRGRS